MFLGLVAAAAVVLFLLAGLNIRGRFFSPEWYAAACTVFVLLSPVLSRLIT